MERWDSPQEPPCQQRDFSPVTTGLDFRLPELSEDEPVSR